MINFKDTNIENCIVHHIGNSTNHGNLILSNKLTHIDDSNHDDLMEYFSKPFTQIGNSFTFDHNIDVNLNEVYVSVKNIFEDEDFLINSQNIAKHLFAKSKHHAIKDGELFVVRFDEIEIDGKFLECIGLYKAERKDTYFDIHSKSSNVELNIKKGFNKQKIDKGCLILNNQTSNDYTVFPYEYNNQDTEYWRREFLNISVIENSYHKTEKHLSLYKGFINNQFSELDDSNRIDQITMLQDGVNFLKNNEKYNFKDFSESVLKKEKLIDSYEQYIVSHSESNAIEDFEISKTAIVKSQRNFKSVLKLDKNFHLYIHGDRQKIERGYDEERGSNYYKIYFDHEF
jgi:hypothetical protein